MSAFLCPECGGSTEVINSRLSLPGSKSRLARRRLCEHGHRFSTIEVPAELTGYGSTRVLRRIPDEHCTGCVERQERLDSIAVMVTHPREEPTT